MILRNWLADMAKLIFHPIRTLDDWLRWPDLSGEDSKEQ